MVGPLVAMSLRMSCLTCMNRLNWIAGSPYRLIAEVIQNRAVCVAGWHVSFSMPHCPGSHPGDPVHADVGDVARRRVVHGREADIGPEVGMSEFLEKLSGSSLGDPGGAVDDQVFVQAHGVALVGFDRQRDAAVVAD